jgi:hypothetical protein
MGQFVFHSGNNTRHGLLLHPADFAAELLMRLLAEKGWCLSDNAGTAQFAQKLFLRSRQLS